MDPTHPPRGWADRRAQLSHTVGVLMNGRLPTPTQHPPTQLSQLAGKLAASKTKHDTEVLSLKARVKKAERDLFTAQALVSTAEKTLSEAKHTAKLEKEAEVNGILAKHASELQAKFEKGAAFAQSLMSK